MKLNTSLDGPTSCFQLKTKQNFSRCWQLTGSCLFARMNLSQVFDGIQQFTLIFPALFMNNGSAPVFMK